MNILLSLNYKFFNLEPKKLIELIKRYDKNNLIKGFEIATKSQEEQEYSLHLARFALEEGYIVNLHSPCFEEENEIKEYIEFAVKISKIMNRKTNIVYHPINANSINESKRKTELQVEKIMKYIEKRNYCENIELSIENLNDMSGLKRLKKEDLIDILNKQTRLNFTYDIGHEIIDGIKTEKLVNILEERLNNIHIHEYQKKLDHYPIKNIKEQKEIKELLEKYGKNKNVVLEYALNYIKGENFETKLKNYIESTKILN